MQFVVESEAVGPVPVGNELLSFSEQPTLTDTKKKKRRVGVYRAK